MLFLCGLLLLISAPSLSLADQQDEKSVESRRLETEEERRERLKLVDFLNVALSTSIEQGRYLKPPEAVARRFAYTYEHISFRRKLGAQLPWLYRRVFRADGLPRLNVINKWEAAPTAIVGLPDPEAWGKGAFWNMPNDEPEGRIAPIILDEVARHLPTLREATGLHVNVSPDSGAVAPDSPIISIVPYSDICAIDLNAFKVGHCSGRYTELSAPLHGNDLGYTFFDVLALAGGLSLTSAIPFTPDTWTQVDGVLFADEDNRLDLALCFIWTGHTEVMTRSLVTECIYRAMGLPDLSTDDRSVVFGKWNGHIDKSVAHYNKNPIQNPCQGNLAGSYLPVSPRVTQHVCERDRLSKLSSPRAIEPSEYDLSLLKALYSDNIVSGEEVYEILSNQIDWEKTNEH